MECVGCSEAVEMNEEVDMNVRNVDEDMDNYMNKNEDLNENMDARNKDKDVDVEELPVRNLTNKT